MSQRKLLIAKLSLIAALPILMLGYAFGPPAYVTGDPKDPLVGGAVSTCNQGGCHVGTPVNGGAGKIQINLPGGNTYVPGQAQQITVTVSDPTQRAWGFELTARLLADNSQAGNLASVDSATFVQCADQSNPPCARIFNTQFVQHTRPKTGAGSATFTFSWTPPAPASGTVVLYAAGNAANGDGQNTGDHIYTTSVQLTPAAVSNGPVITPSGAVSHGTSSTTIQPGSWVDIFGSNLAPQTPNGRCWNAATEIINGVFPTSLDGVSVKINGKSAAVYCISPALVVVQSPDDTATGTVSVTVTTSVGTTAGVAATIGTVSPTFFTFDGFKYIAAEIPDSDGSGAFLSGTANSYDYLGPPGKLGFTTRSAKKGEIVELFLTGLGPANPVVPAGKVVAPGLYPTVSSVTVNIGGVSQTVTAYITFAGLYQMNVTIPQNIGSGDIPLSATVNGVVSQPATAVISVQ